MSEAPRQSAPKAGYITLFLAVMAVLASLGLAMGCMVGNILSGWALLSVGMFLFGLATLVGNWLVTHFYLMGGSFSELPFTFGRVFRRR